MIHVLFCSHLQLDDVDSFMAAIKGRGAALDPSTTFIAGQSMGGLVAAQVMGDKGLKAPHLAHRPMLFGACTE
jgi:dienelactone hydrolase